MSASRPVLGILATRREGSWRFHGNVAYFRRLCALGGRHGLLVTVFTPEDLGDASMRAHVFERGAWRRREVALPSVVYNRVADRLLERTPAVAAAKRFFAERGIPFFNRGFFDKWSVHRWASRSPEARRWLLPTERVGDAAQVRDFLENHGLVYFKPVDGRAGEGILRARAVDARWELVSDGARARWLASPAAVARAVVRATRDRAHVMQRGVALAVVHGRPFDLCVLAQKDERGRWATTGTGASVATGPGVIITHYGSSFTPAHALAEAFGLTEARRIQREARDLGPILAAAIERHGAADDGAALGELSLDVGVGADGRLWLFEANAKPMPSNLPEIRARAAGRLLDFCRHLARG